MSSANVIPSVPELYPMNEITQINVRLPSQKKSQTYRQN